MSGGSARGKFRCAVMFFVWLINLWEILYNGWLLEY